LGVELEDCTKAKPSARHWAHATGSDEEKLKVFRRVRDEIKRVFEAYAAGRKDAAKAKV